MLISCKSSNYKTNDSAQSQNSRSNTIRLCPLRKECRPCHNSSDQSRKCMWLISSLYDATYISCICYNCDNDRCPCDDLCCVHRETNNKHRHNIGYVCICKSYRTIAWKLCVLTYGDDICYCLCRWKNRYYLFFCISSAISRLTIFGYLSRIGYICEIHMCILFLPHRQSS